MAAEEKKAPEGQEAAPKKKGLPKTAILIGAIMLLEAGGFLAAMKFMGGGPSTAQASESGEGGHGESAEGGPGGGAEGGHGGAAAESGHGEAKEEGGHGEAAGGKGGHEGGATYVKKSAPNATAEVKVLTKFRVPNSKSGRNYVYDFDIAAVVPEARKAEAEKLITDKGGEIADRAAQIIRSADAKVLAEDDFETLRMQMRQTLVRICGDEKLIVRVLIPRCVPMRTD